MHQDQMGGIVDEKKADKAGKSREEGCIKCIRNQGPQEFMMHARKYDL